MSLMFAHILFLPLVSMLLWQLIVLFRHQRRIHRLDAKEEEAAAAAAAVYTDKDTMLGSTTHTMHGRQVSLQHVSSETISKVKRLNAVLFPVQYSHSFYKALVMPDQHAMLALVDVGTDKEKSIGTVGVRKQPWGFADSPAGAMQRPGAPAVLEAYIMTLGVLAPYRRLGVGRVLLESAVAYARADPAVRRLVLHVHITNDDALRFYHASGFSTVRIVENYYRRIEQPHAYLLEYRVR